MANDPAASLIPYINTRCLKCGHEWHAECAVDNDVKTATCPACNEFYDERHVECWAQIIWPYPLCPSCRAWAETKRPCSMSSHGECDCPKCFGTCTCGDDF